MPVTPPDELTIRWDETAERTVGVGDLARTRPELVAHHRRDKAKRKPASGPRGKPPEPKPKPNASTTYGGSSGSCGRRTWPTTRNGGRNPAFAAAGAVPPVRVQVSTGLGPASEAGS